MKNLLPICLFLLLTLCAPKAHAQKIGAHDARKTLSAGQSEIYVYDRMTTAAVGSPLVADIVPLSARQLLVNAKAPGETTLFVCDRAGTHRLRLRVVAVPTDLRPAAAAMASAIGLRGVTARAVGDTVLLEGEAPSLLAVQRVSVIAGVYAPKVKNLVTVMPAAAVLGPTLAETYAALLTPSLAPLGVSCAVVDGKTLAFSGRYRGAIRTGSAGGEGEGIVDAVRGGARRGGGNALGPEAAPPDPVDLLVQSLPPDLKVINLLNLGGGPTRQILVRAKIIDINRSAAKNLGVQWGTGGVGSTRGGSSYTFQPQPIVFGQIGTASGFYSNPLGGGGLNRVSPLAAQLNLLITENKARVLSEPSLMVLDGCTGSILVGGEIPIPVAQSSSGTGGVSASVAIEYKPYGVRLLVGAALVGDKTVQMTVTPEVSELDYGAGLQLSGFSVPALTVRRATSTLQMTDGETLVIGGLYRSIESRQVNRIPLLSQIPVIGEFFKNTLTRKEESELLILIQPEIVTPATVGAYPPPAGSPENLPVQRPSVGPADFDKDFPNLQKGGGDGPKPGPPVVFPVPKGGAR